ncbi:hypothetical protein [Antrihabitans sp. YC2-6]|uniref:hypothetical protein n=1 Tax=Antrihabitans sp. YC2-6 TaxID=2799498 RepID=UPI0018F72FE4|nr:hypothetical protein [Antrihabitans sp. YC2-6]MBJ8348583.1 hypothetical protein [Antrihabitans sp. YC2-6]
MKPVRNTGDFWGTLNSAQLSNVHADHIDGQRCFICAAEFLIHPVPRSIMYLYRREVGQPAELDAEPVSLVACNDCISSVWTECTGEQQTDFDAVRRHGMCMDMFDGEYAISLD